MARDNNDGCMLCRRAGHETKPLMCPRLRFLLSDVIILLRILAAFQAWFLLLFFCWDPPNPARRPSKPSYFRSPFFFHATFALGDASASSWDTVAMVKVWGCSCVAFGSRK